MPVQMMPPRDDLLKEGFYIFPGRHDHYFHSPLAHRFAFVASEADGFVLDIVIDTLGAELATYATLLEAAEG